MANLKVKLLCDTAKLPSRGSEYAAGYDISSSSKEPITIKSMESASIPTGLAMQIPKGLYGRVAPRSGLAFKNGIDVGAGVIDSDYSGEVKVLLFNFGKTDYTVNLGDRVAQLILELIANPDIEQVKEIDSTSRGYGGFGSTGK